jgi:predicted nucleic acid-binding protein
VIYVDTSVFVAAFTMEPAHTRKAQRFLMQEADIQASSWTVTEFASALMIKLRRGDIDDDYRLNAWLRFKELISARALVRPVPTDAYMEAADLVIQSNELRAADALHLVIARQIGCSELATFDKALAKASRKYGVGNVSL